MNNSLEVPSEFYARLPLSPQPSHLRVLLTPMLILGKASTPFTGTHLEHEMFVYFIHALYPSLKEFVVPYSIGGTGWKAVAKLFNETRSNPCLVTPAAQKRLEKFVGPLRTSN